MSELAITATDPNILRSSDVLFGWHERLGEAGITFTDVDTLANNQAYEMTQVMQKADGLLLVSVGASIGEELQFKAEVLDYIACAVEARKPIFSEVPLTQSIEEAQLSDEQLRAARLIIHYADEHVVGSEVDKVIKVLERPGE